MDLALGLAGGQVLDMALGPKLGLEWHLELDLALELLPLALRCWAQH